MLADRRIRWGFGDFVIAWVLTLLIGQFVVFAVVLGARGGGTDHEVDSLDIAIVTAASACVTYLAARFVAQLKGRGSVRADFGLVVRAQDWRWLVVGAALQVVAIVAVALIGELAGSTPTQGVTDAIEGSPVGTRILAGVAVVVAAPLAEELLFRGILLRSLLRRMSAVGAVALSAALFAAAHLLDPDTAVLLAPLALVGVVCAVRAVRTGDLSQSILVHAGFNAVTAVILVLAG